MNKPFSWLILFKDTEIKEATMTFFNANATAIKPTDRRICGVTPLPVFLAWFLIQIGLVLAHLPQSDYTDFQFLEISLSRSHLNLLELVSPPMQEIAQKFYLVFG